MPTLPRSQIISITEDGNEFRLHDDALRRVLRHVPAGMSVGVVSVVGAFRTGKSFLLDFILRYLRQGGGEQSVAAGKESADWIERGEQVLEGRSGSDRERMGFSWRSGRERTTTVRGMRRGSVVAPVVGPRKLTHGSAPGHLDVVAAVLPHGGGDGRGDGGDAA